MAMPAKKLVPIIAIGPEDGESFASGDRGEAGKVDGVLDSGDFAVVHHPMAPRALAAPLHRHHKEGE